MTRREQIIELLHLRNELTPSSPNTIRGSGDATPLLPHDRHCTIHRTAPATCNCWIESLTELNRCLTNLRSTHWQLYDHCRLRYLEADRRPRTITVKNHRPELAPNQQLIGLIDWRSRHRVTRDISRNGNGQARVQIETWNPRADPAKALKAVDWLANNYQGEPRLLDLAA